MSPFADVSPSTAATAPRATRRARSHLPAAALFLALSIAWTFPLVLHLGSAIPGLGASAGDNVCFVWNLWWARTALNHHLNPFYTNWIFHPVGVDLTQHTHTAVSGALAATVLAPLSPIAAQNVLLVLFLFLNGFVAYLLAHRLGADRLGALAAGIAFGGAAPVLVRLYGHFNLVGAWVIPAALLMLLRALDRRSVARSAAAGAALALCAYADYYYLIYSLVLLAAWVACRWFRFEVHFPARRRNVVTAIFGALLVLDLAVMAAIVVTGGFTLRPGALAISMQTTFNERVAFWILLAGWALSRRRVLAVATRRMAHGIRVEASVIAIVASTCAIATLPLVVGAARLMLANDYTSQVYGWRSAPAGVDLTAFVLGNPLHGLYGSLTRRAYDAFGIGVVEGTAWLGAVALILTIVGWRRLRDTEEAQACRAAVVIFGIWALGPYLVVCGFNTGLILPETLLRFVPIAANARIPGRAIVVVSLATAVLAAMTLTRLGPASSRRRTLVAALLLLDVATGPLPLYRPAPSAVYDRLRTDAVPGAVLELPLGLRDGFGEVGRFDSRTLLWQTIHGRPMLGGFVARLPLSVKRWYGGAPVVSTLLKLSDPACPANWNPPAVSKQQAYDALAPLSVRFVVIDQTLASAALVRYVASLPLTPLTADRGRQLYELRKP